MTSLWRWIQSMTPDEPDEADDVRPWLEWCGEPRGMHRCTLRAGHDDLHHCCCVVNWADDEVVEP